MKFPGENEITLTENAIRELLKSQAPSLFGDEGARITKIATKNWPGGLVVTFTTDPDPSAPIPEAPPSLSMDPAPSRPRPNPRSAPTSIEDDRHPF